MPVVRPLACPAPAGAMAAACRQSACRRGARHPGAALAALVIGLIAQPALAAPFGASPVAGTSAAPAMGDEAAGAPLPALRRTPPPMENNEGPIAFEADKVDYADWDSADPGATKGQVVASGNVFLRRGEQSVRANKVTWDRASGKILAEGDVRALDADGNQLLTDALDLTDRFEIGDTQNLLMLLREGGRLAAERGQRNADGVVLLDHASYTACEVVDSKGCPRKPTWRITAQKVAYNPKTHTLRFRGARLAAFGVLRIPVPNTTVSTNGGAVPGLLIPDFRTSASNGAEYKQTYYQHLGPDKDIAITGEVFTQAAPMLSTTYRQLTDLGAFQATGYVTKSAVIPVSGAGTDSQEQLRGYIETNGKFQFTPEWSLTYSGRLASDRTFLRRYYINSDDVLRSTFDVEHINHNSYFSIAGWAFQTQRTNEAQSQVPFALPEIDYRRRIDSPILGGTLDLQANSLAVSRSEGQDTQRAFASAQWNLRRLTPWGQQITLTGLLRGDAYHSSENQLTTTASYQGLPGWHTRGLALGAVDITWPLIGAAFGGSQVLTPHVQLVAAPPTGNLSLPNEDSRAIELEDDNIFALNRFAGYDRMEDGVRVTYGLSWQLDRPQWRVNANIAQSYRMTHETVMPDGSGLTDQLSDIVGRTEVRFRDFFKITHRYRIDKSTGAFRRNEADVTLGSDQTYLELGYARINRQNVSTSVEDISDSNELRAAGRIALLHSWSVFGSGIVDMSRTPFTDGTNTVNPAPFQPLRTRLGVAYQSDCFEFALTWRRDYVTIGDVSRGSSFELHFALRNLGFR